MIEEHTSRRGFIGSAIVALFGMFGACRFATANTGNVMRLPSWQPVKIWLIVTGKSTGTCVWTGAALNGLWKDPGNWNTGRVPTSGVDVHFFTREPHVLNAPLDVTLGEVVLHDSCSVQIDSLAAHTVTIGVP